MFTMTKQEIDAAAFYYASDNRGRINERLYEAKKKELREFARSQRQPPAQDNDRT